MLWHHGSWPATAACGTDRRSVCTHGRQTCHGAAARPHPGTAAYPHLEQALAGACGHRRGSGLPASRSDEASAHGMGVRHGVAERPHPRQAHGPRSDGATARPHHGFAARPRLGLVQHGATAQRHDGAPSPAVGGCATAPVEHRIMTLVDCPHPGQIYGRFRSIEPVTNCT